MRKRRSGRNQAKRDKPTFVSVNSDDEYAKDAPDPNSHEFMNDEIDNYHEHEEKLLIGDSKLTRKGDESDEEEIYPLSYDDEVDMASDIEDEKLPDDALAWGKNRVNYYNTDYVDGDYGGFQGSDAELAEEEEREAKVIQKRLLETLDEADYDIEIIKTSKRPAEDLSHERVTKDLSQLSKQEKIDLVIQESPELLNILEDFQMKIKELVTKFQPLADLTRDENNGEELGVEYVRLKQQLILNYCTNVCFYMMLKAKRIPVENHPVMKRMVTYRNLLKQIQPLDEKLQKEIDVMCQEMGKGKLEMKGNKKIKLLDKNNERVTKKQIVDRKNLAAEILRPKQTAAGNKSDVKGSLKTKTTETLLNSKQVSIDDEQGDGKRAVNYKIMKNKGMRPYRKKELRNPRVSNKIKYRKAVIRRKGQYRQPRKELERYGGEISGVNARVSKSVKFK